MGKVSNPYSFNIEQDYTTYTNISNLDDNYNFVFIVGQNGRNYGYSKNNFGTIIKNTTSYNISEFVGDEKYMYIDVNTDIPTNSVIVSELGDSGTVTVFHEVAPSDKILQYLIDNVGNKVRFNITN